MRKRRGLASEEIRVVTVTVDGTTFECWKDLASDDDAPCWWMFAVDGEEHELAPARGLTIGDLHYELRAWSEQIRVVAK